MSSEIFYDKADVYKRQPYAAVEEALSNAVYHKGYDEREPIEVRVEPDRIIIVSHPGADRSKMCIRDSYGL